MDDDTSYMAVKYYRDSDQKLDGYHTKVEIFLTLSIKRIFLDWYQLA